MSTLKYRLVTNWPASMSEDFTFELTEDRNAHYDLCVEILSCIADEKDPSSFRVTEETIYEYEVKRPKEPSLPRMPIPSEGMEGDTEFLEVCHKYIFADKARFARGASERIIHVSVTESFTLEGEELARMAQIAKENRAEAKFRFILAAYGVEDDEVALREAFEAAGFVDHSPKPARKPSRLRSALAEKRIAWGLGERQAEPEVAGAEEQEPELAENDGGKAGKKGGTGKKGRKVKKGAKSKGKADASGKKGASGKRSKKAKGAQGAKDDKGSKGTKASKGSKVSKGKKAKKAEKPAKLVKPAKPEKCKKAKKKTFKDVERSKIVGGHKKRSKKKKG